MSLNGLAAPSIKDAHEKAASKPGGWFLLKYASRDEIELLSCGNGGTGEMRNAIARYKDPSPLFGFLRYRRRNVIIKYIPEECSRLVQARVTVHFNAITEHFSPYNMTFSMTSTKELRDTALSALCSLHTASGSTSSSTSSINRRRLIEIAEEEENNEVEDDEDDEDEEEDEESEEGEESRLKRESMASEISEGEPCTARAISISESLATVSSKELISSSRSHFWKSSMSGSLPSSNSSKVRPSTSNQSDSTISGYPLSDNSTHISVLNGRPKVRLGPRPSQDTGARPCALTSGCYRPISTLPAGLKSFAKGSREREKPKSTGDPANYSIISNSTTPTSLLQGSDLLKRPPSSSGRPTTSSGLSFRSIPSPTISINSKPQAADLARARLLRAQEMRKKKMEISRSLDSDMKPVPSDIKVSEMTPPASPISGAKYEPHLTNSNDPDRAENMLLPVDFDGTLIESGSDSNAESNYTTLHGRKLTGVSASDNLTKKPATEITQDNLVTSTDLNLSCTMTKPDTIDISEVGGSKFDLNTPESENPQSKNALCKAKDNVSVRISTTEGNSPSNDGASTLTLLGKENLMQSESGFSEINESTPHPGKLKKSHLKKNEVSKAKFISSDAFAHRTNFIIDNKSSAPLTPEKSPKGVIITNSSPDPSKQNGFSIKVPTDETMPYQETEDGDRLKTIQARLKKQVNTQTEIETTDLNVAESDCGSSSDDEFIDELQSATIEDAKPVSVAKSPIGSSFNLPSSSSKQNFYSISSCVSSNPLLRDNSSKSPIAVTISPENLSSVPTSAVSKRISSLPNLNIAKKSNLGSGISQRIKAFEKLSIFSSDSDIPQGNAAATPTFFSVRKKIVRTTSHVKLQFGSDDPNSSVRKNLTVTHDLSSSTSRVQILSNTSPKTEPISPSFSNFNSTTAHTVMESSRDSSTDVKNGGICVDLNAFNLQKSALKIDGHEKKDLKRVDASSQILDSRKKLEGNTGNFNCNKKERRSSLTVMKDLLNESRGSITKSCRSISYENLGQQLNQKSPYYPPPVHTSARHNQDHSISSRRSSIGRDTVNSHPPSPENSITSSFSDKNEGKESPTSRGLHNLSSSLSTGKKPISQTISSTVPEASEQNVPLRFEKKSSPTPENVTIIGDVNVQFPDSLLWKRKTMLLDSHGYFILAPVTSEYPQEISKDKQINGVLRKFHMSELKKPYIPDLETEELPNSIMFDINEGGILQIACQNRPAQGNILKILQDSYSNFTMNL
ncbi:hypothetical protein GcM1_247095 [Golovinomyces cichoracearum]|uniref:Gpi-anchored cell surface glycoprotein n=1 Tax=Golovinomyces cichoracearum TaxID=62708 RepID=A0A420IDK4_9PEZI|nr:hypothetical protein GcM1_247095 [Golovinomyces cichoracearum]